MHVGIISRRPFTSSHLLASLGMDINFPPFLNFFVVFADMISLHLARDAEVLHLCLPPHSIVRLNPLSSMISLRHPRSSWLCSHPSQFSGSLLSFLMHTVEEKRTKASLRGACIADLHLYQHPNQGYRYRRLRFSRQECSPGECHPYSQATARHPQRL